jgi:asparagine synthase (glutamine-hydrolysing)
MLPLTSDADPRSRRSRLSRLAQAARHDSYRDLVSVFPEALLKRLLPGSAAKATRGSGFFGGYPPRGVESAINEDLANYLPDDLLRKTDSASMAVALEVRCPFLAPGVAGPASKATISSLMPRGQRKGLLRQVARKYLPADIVDRPKQGFAIPIGEWFRNDYGGMKQLLLDHLNSAEPWGPPSIGIDLNMKFVRQMLDEHMDRRRDHSQRLYMLLVLSIWAKWLGSLGKG